MKIITIREEKQTETGFEATLSFDNNLEYPITITNPFNLKEERRLEWYFEEWLQYPMLDRVKARNAADSIKTYGENLFEQVFANKDAYQNYEQLRWQLNQVKIEIVSRTPEFQALHWEALRDPDLPRPLAIDCVILRKYDEVVPAKAYVKESPVVNLLVVVARPDEEDDIGYQTISRPLIEAIENSQLRVNVHLLRPGTYEALERHLEQKGAGYYHVIHFDVHGALMTYQQFQNSWVTNRYVYGRGYGFKNLQPYIGIKAFLFLEGEKKGNAVPIEATELGSLLTSKMIPVCILTTCDSGKQIHLNTELPQEEYYRDTSLASHLIRAGTQMVVAMGYSVTVSAAVLMMQELYRHLFAREQLATAIRLSRKELYQQKSRGAYFNEAIDLEDWLLPVVYGNGQVNLNLRQFTFQEKKEYFLRRSQRYRFPAPTYGFVGRDLEIMKLEKALLKENILLLQGMGGTGKTTLLNYLREWWPATNFAGKIFYFGYDEKAWNLQQIVFTLGSQVYEEEEERAIFQVTPLAAQVEELIELLRANGYVLILDNLESVTGQQLAIENTLPEAERNQLRDFLARLVGGNTKVVLGSRGSEDWLKERTFQDNVYQLRGLDREARTVLAQRILEQNVAGKRIEKIKEEEDFTKLMKLLAGYPLAMEVVLANLKKQSPAEVLVGLQAADLELDRQGEDKTRSILKCVEYSHSNLSPDAQKLLLCLAPFSGFIWQGGIFDYGEELKKLEPFKDYPFDKFDAAIEEAINWGLLSPSQDVTTFLTIQPIFPYFLKAKLDDEAREALEEGFKNHYIKLANYYNQLMQSKKAKKRQLGIFSCLLEYKNLYNALLLGLKKHETVNIFFCLFKYLNLIKDFATSLKLAEFVWEAQETYPEEMRTGEIGLDIVLILHRLATGYLQTKNYSQAKESYKQVIELTQQLKGIEELEKQLALANGYHGLGNVAQELREWDEARNNYHQALAIYIEYSAPGRGSLQDRCSQASTYHNLGRVASELREWDEARNNYQQALAIYIEYGAPGRGSLRDRCSQASTYHNLGRVASELREWDEARNNYQQALAIYIEYGDRYSQAGTYHNLGVVAQELREWDEARNNYQQALAIYIEYSDRYSQASPYHNLGMIALELREWNKARNNYQQALAIYIEYSDRYSQANIYHQLGNVALELRGWDEARSNYQQALAIYIEYSDRYSQAGTYQNLGRVASELREWDEARNNYQQALAIYIEYGDRYSQAGTYHNLGVVAQELREWDEARNNYQQALAIYIEYSDRYSQAGTYHNLGVVAQELREWDEARNNYQQALAIYIEYSDRYSQASPYHNLGMIALELREWNKARNNYQQALAIYIEYSDRYSQANIYHQLGNVALELREWDEARNNYQQALAIYIEYGDRYSQAGTYHNLGVVASELREWDEARNNYQQALAIYIEYGDRHSQAKTYHQLGNVALELRGWDEARSNYQQALAIYIEYDDRYSQALTYQNLGMVALRLREWDKARNNYQQALAIFIEYGDRYSQANTYHQLGNVALELRGWDEARSNYQQALAIYIEYSDRYSQANTYHQLGNVALELRGWDEARSNYQQALAIYIEYSDRYSQAGTYHCLGTVAEKLEEYSKAKAYYLQALQNWAEFNDTYSLETFSIPALAHLYGKTQDSSLLAQIASILGVKVEELKQIFAPIVGEKLENYQQALTNIEYSESQEKASTYNNLDRIELEKFSKEQNPLLNIPNTISILDRETKYGMLSSLRAQNQIPIDFIPLGNLFYQEYDFLNLVFDSKQKLIEVSEKERMRLFKDTWNAVDSALEYNQIEVFRTKVDELTKLFCQSLAFTMLDDSSTLGQFYGQMIDASNSAFQLNIRPNFPLIYPCKTEFTEEDVYKISGLLNKFGIVAHFFALIIDFGNNPEMNQQVRESAYKNDFIVLNRDRIWDILAAKSPVQQLTNCILEQIDLVAISPYTVSGPVKRKMFFGRAKEEKILLQNIDRNNYALLANRKTGKTSLLNTIYPLLKSLPTYQVFYCDLQVVNNYDLFYQELALAYPELEEKIANFSNTSPLLFHRLIRNLNQQSNNRKFIFIFDEVDDLLAYDLENQEQLFKTFRSLSQRENIGFIFSGTTTLVKRMRHPHSPLFNFCSPLKIGFLEEKAAEELIRVPMKTLGVKFENESAIVQDLLKLTVGHPNTIQYICDSLIQIINQKQKRIITEEYVNEVVTSQEFYEYFKSLIWGQSTALEKLIVYLMWSYQEFTDSEVIEEFKGRNIPIEGVKSSLETLLIYSTLSKKNNKYYFTFKEFAKLMKKRSDIEELTEQYQLEVISCPAALSL